ncbi:MAG: nucleotidyltransferase domain-containing protein [Cyanobacteria bacterium P01_G01_bin.54]
MLPTFPIDDAKKRHIQQQLQQLEQTHAMQIILAIESGSRAWGFPSPDSDYDVRFVYVRSPAQYLSIQPYRDVIETPIVEDAVLASKMDMNGWDLRKALNIAFTANLTLIEWLCSPIHYIQRDAATPLRDFVRQMTHLPTLAHRYQNWLFNVTKTSTDPAQVKLKSYCYGLRLALAVRWIAQRQTAPPMDLPSLAVLLDETLHDRLAELVQLKFTQAEQATVPRVPEFDDLIAASLAESWPKPAPIAPTQTDYKQADRLFQTLMPIGYAGES